VGDAGGVSTSGVQGGVRVTTGCGEGIGVALVNVASTTGIPVASKSININPSILALRV
jgi:hypothetical protein